MPKYDTVKEEDQLPNRTHRRQTETSAPTPAEEPAAWVTITTTIPAEVRRDLNIALAVHNTKLKDAVTAALRAWLDEHPVQVR